MHENTKQSGTATRNFSEEAGMKRMHSLVAVLLLVMAETMRR